jgi:hypothetical protein
MIGIILTLVAVLLVLCFAFYYADHPSGTKSKPEASFYAEPKGFKKDYNRGNR